METASVKEAAEVLEVSTKTVRKYLKSGRLPFQTVEGKYGDEYAIPRSALEEFQGRVADRGVSTGGSNGRGVMELYTELLQRHEQAVIRLGYLQSGEERRLALEEEAQSLREEREKEARKREELEVELQSREKELAKAEAVAQALQDQVGELEGRVAFERSYRTWFPFSWVWRRRRG